MHMHLFFQSQFHKNCRLQTLSLYDYCAIRQKKTHIETGKWRGQKMTISNNIRFFFYRLHKIPFIVRIFLKFTLSKNSKTKYYTWHYLYCFFALSLEPSPDTKQKESMMSQYSHVKCTITYFKKEALKCQQAPVICFEAVTKGHFRHQSALLGSNSKWLYKISLVIIAIS